MENGFTPGPWEIDWFVCRAEASDVVYAKSEGRKLEAGDELWRVPHSIGPLSIDHNHWAGDHIDGTREDIILAAAAPDLLEALEAFAGWDFAGSAWEDADEDAAVLYDHKSGRAITLGQFKAASLAINRARGRV